MAARTAWTQFGSDKPSPVPLLLPTRKSFCCSPRFTTKRKRKICASPTDNAVQKLMQNLDKKTKKDTNSKNRQTQRPRSKPRKQRRQRV